VITKGTSNKRGGKHEKSIDLPESVFKISDHASSPGVLRRVAERGGERTAAVGETERERAVEALGKVWWIVSSERETGRLEGRKGG